MLRRHFNPLYTVVINVVFWAVSIPPAWFSLALIGKDKSDNPKSVESEEKV